MLTADKHTAASSPSYSHPHERRKKHPVRSPMHDGHWQRRRAALEQLARELEQIRECECGVQSWDLLQSISSLLGKAEQKQWLSQKEQQRALDWLAAAISR